MLHADNVGTTVAHDFAYLAQLARTIVQYDYKVCLATGGDLTAGDNAGKNIYVDIAARNEALLI